MTTPEEPDPSKKEMQRHERQLSLLDIQDTLVVAQPKRWFLLLSILVVLILLVIWAFLGRIPTEVMGKTVAIASKGFSLITAKTKGTVTAINVHEREEIPQGAYLGTIYNPDQRTLLYKILNSKDNLKSVEAELAILEKSLETRKVLLEQGLISKTTVDSTEISVLQQQNKVQDIKNEIVALIVELEKSSYYWEEELRDIPIPRLTENLSLLTAVESKLSNLYSPTAGEVLEIFVNPGNQVDTGQSLFLIAQPKNPEEPLQFYSAVPIENADKIRVGMSAQIDPSDVNKQLYGSLLGVVKEVSSFVVSEQELLSTLQNKQLVAYLSQGGKPMRLVVVEPIRAHSTVSGYKWTSAKGPPFQIPNGSVGDVRIQVEEQPPISYLIPLWRIKEFK